MTVYDIQQQGIISDLISHTCLACICFVSFIQASRGAKREFSVSAFMWIPRKETSQQQSLLGQNAFAVKRRVCGFENICNNDNKKKNKREALTLRLAGVGVKCSQYIFTGLFELSPLVRR